jgi:hypothetical protein
VESPDSGGFAAVLGQGHVGEDQELAGRDENGSNTDGYYEYIYR